MARYKSSFICICANDAIIVMCELAVLHRTHLVCNSFLLYAFVVIVDFLRAILPVIPSKCEQFLGLAVEY